jgi:alanine racemase
MEAPVRHQKTAHIIAGRFAHYLLRHLAKSTQVSMVRVRRQAEEPARIGVIPMGIADGLRALSCGEVLVRGRRCRLVGSLSLEHARVDLSDVPDAERGDEVVVVGTQGDQEITPAEVERANGLASSGLVLAAGASVQRVYLRNGALLSS